MTTNPIALLHRLLALLVFLALPLTAGENEDAFRKRLTTHPWQWKPADVASSFGWDRMEFQADGKFATSKSGKPGFASTWRSPEVGKVEVMNKDAVGLVISFDGFGLAAVARTAAGKPAGTASILDWQGLSVSPPSKTGQDKGGKSATMADLEFILSRYGSPKVDLNPRPGTMIYRGPKLIGVVEHGIKIPYLASKEEAENLLFEKVPTSSKQRPVAPGFPEGLELTTYDIRYNGFNRLTLITDRADRVVGLQFKAENIIHSPDGDPGWGRLEREFHTFDFVRMEERGKGMEISCYSYDSRKDGNFIVFQTLVPAIKETTRCYLPAPIIDLILHNIKEAGARVP